MSQLKITQTKESKIDKVNWDNLGFGMYLSDHVFMAEYKDGSWNDGEIIPYAPMPIEPAMCTLHYGQTIFEGLKAFRAVNGDINIFRPDRNAARLANSSVLLCIPPFDTQKLIDGIKQLVRYEEKWVPSTRGHSLYLRPLVFGDGNFLGVHASKTYKLIVMTAPVASYYPEGLNPVKIMVAHKHVRAVRGGLGMAKTAANYAASLYASEQAKKDGFSQVLWLDGIERSFIDEVGAMNIMFVIKDTIITPPLTQGTILEGVTRDSVLTLARDKGLKVEERSISIYEIFEAYKKGDLQEAFGTGTAAVISPVGLLHYNGEAIHINDMKIGKLSQMFYDTITGIQYGEIEDKFGWIVKC